MTDLHQRGIYHSASMAHVTSEGLGLQLGPWRCSSCHLAHQVYLLPGALPSETTQLLALSALACPAFCCQ